MTSSASTRSWTAQPECSCGAPARNRSFGCWRRLKPRLRPANSLIPSPPSFDESSAEASDGEGPATPGSAHVLEKELQCAGSSDTSDPEQPSRSSSGG